MDSVPETRSVRRSPRTSKSPDNNAAKESGKARKKTSNLQETRRRGRMDRSKGEEDIANQLNNLDLCNEASATGTGLVFDNMFTRHYCLWDPSHPECPERVTTIMDMVEKQGLLSRCVTVEARAASNEELRLVHTKEHVDLMRSTQHMDEDQLKTLADSYDSVYIHPESYTCASLAVGSVLQLVDKVMTSELQNGFSVARPPGHHAQVDQMNGYCMFNNLAIAARYAQTHHRVERVLIVDWDVHHGQGIQYIFQEDPSVLYFSVHRYEEGLFWPHLPESDSSAVGTGSGEGYNINLPWNKIGMKDADYVAAFQQLLLPVAYEFQPQLVLVAAGFDSVIGDPKGEMSASPQCFSVLTHMLLGLAQGKLLLVLEGGYNLQSTAEGVCACLRSLLGESCPRLGSPSIPSDSALKSISRSISALYPYWTSLQVLEGGPLSDSDPLTPALTPAESSEELCEERRDSLDLTTGLVYDQRMMEHHNIWDSHHPELPQRIQRIFSRHEDLGLVSRCLRIPARLALEEELALCHSLEHIAKIKATEGMKTRDLHRLGDEYNSIFISTESYRSARLAAGACFNAVQAVLTGQVRNGVAIVRPPGHHAEKDAACGFCFFNTAALTARYAQSISQQPLRVLILDWDVHHGNGTQHIFEEDDSVLYISLHRYEDGTFFPTSEDAHYNRVGKGKGTGFNVNIPWNGAKMGDAEYLAAFHSVVMPIAREFDPGLVLVSAGFDAARGDPLGGYQVTPPGYAHLTHLLMGLAGGRVLVILEGGYNLTAISESMSACTSILLGDPALPLPPLVPPHPNAAVSINKVIRTHSAYWLSLRIQLPESLRLSLPNPKPRGKRTSKGKKSPRQRNQGGTSPGQGSPQTPSQTPSQTTPLPSGGRGDLDLDDLTKGLVSLDLNQSTSANPSPASVPVGGARSKVRFSPTKSPVKEVKTEAVPNTPEILQPTPDKTETQAVAMAASDPVTKGDQESGAATVEVEGASGYSKEPVFELFCGNQDVDGSTMYVVDPLSWCPHLDSVKPVPAGGIDVFRPCEDCGTDTENWICLCCYKVYCGRYVNQHMVTHGLVSEHRLVLSFADLSVWCYSCQAYVHNQMVFEAKNAAHCMKFGEDMPLSN
ncbi:histone deacetylase 6 isoform X3 [Salmo salar]|uniref:Histone deacetylase 6 isoform X3 n=1 Tax=Salmo salar TaxID=8030 RepID=A0ABM3D104_SALSA|nr:histone deacetylase 6 isoform X3 [Salmo salar]